MKTPVDTKAKILDAGAKLVGKYGAVNVTRKMVAESAKVSAAIIAYHIGNSAEAQKAFKKHAKKLGIAEPSKDVIEAQGVKLRAHGPRKNKVVRKRSIKEVKAIKNKVVLAAHANAKPIGKVVKVSKNTVTAKLNAEGDKLLKKAKKVVAKKPVAAKPAPARAAKKNGSVSSPAPTSTGKKTAARKPKAPPVNPVEALPPLPGLPALPALH